MFLVSLHSTGGSALLETPLAYGPRHWGQNRSATGSAASNTEDSRAAPMRAVSPTAQILVNVIVGPFSRRSTLEDDRTVHRHDDRRGPGVVHERDQVVQLM